MCAASGLESALARPYTCTHASRPPARPFALSIAAAAVSQRHGVMLGSAAPQAALLVSLGQELFTRAADSAELIGCCQWEVGPTGEGAAGAAAGSEAVAGGPAVAYGHASAS